MPKYLLLKYYRNGPEPRRPVPPMDQWAPEDVEAHIALYEARQRVARGERRVRRRAGAHAGAHLGGLRRAGRRACHHRLARCPRPATWSRAGS